MRPRHTCPTLAGTVLFLDDDPAVSRSHARLLRAAGFTVTTVSSVQGVSELRGRFDCAVLDVTLPDGDGVAVARSLLDVGLTERVVFFTGLGYGRRLEAARRMGPVIFKGQPVEDLLAALGGGAVVKTQPRTAKSQVA